MKALAALLLASQLGGLVQAAETRAFNVGSLEGIRRTHSGKPFVLAFWSIHCEPCRHEMPLWRAMRQKYPSVPILLVAADPPGERDRGQQFLARHDPGPVERWWYDDEVEERVRYAVDPKWRGELPRTYFHEAGGKVEARTGVPDAKELERWFAKVAR